MGTVHSRIHWIDSLKGFAILCVVLGHIITGYLDDGLYLEHIYGLTQIHDLIVSFNMPLFFMINGFLFSKIYCKSGFAELESRRMRTQVFNLLMIYVLYSVLLVAVRMLFGAFVNHPAAFTDILRIWVKPILLYWYLYVLIEMYLIFAIEAIRKLNEWVLFLILFFLSMAVYSGRALLTDWFQLRRLSMYALFFYMGVLFCRYGSEKQKTSIPNEVFVITSVILTGGGVALLKSLSKDIACINLMCAILISAGVFLAFQRIPCLGRNIVFENIGTYCLEVYVLHYFFAMGFRRFDRLLNIKNVYISVSSNFLIAVTIPIAFAWVSKKWRFHDVFFRPYQVLQRYCAKRKTDS